MGVIDEAKKLLGDAWTDEAAEKLATAAKAEADAASKTAVAAATDATKAQLAAQKKAAAEAKAKAAEFEAQLASAGKTDEAVAAALKTSAEAQAKAASLEIKLKVRDIRDAAVSQLAESKVEERRIPEEKRAAALKLLDVSGVDLDDSGAVVGLAAKVEALQTECPWLWAADAAQQSGHGGGRAGGDGKANPGDGTDDDSPAAVARKLQLDLINTGRLRQGLKPIEVH